MDTNSQIVFSTCANMLTPFVGSQQAALIASLMVAQTQNETANFTSNAFLQLNNVCGYKWVTAAGEPASSLTLAVGAGFMSSEGDYPYAKYNSVNDSAADLVNWLIRHSDYGSGAYDVTIDLESIVDCSSYAAAFKSEGYFGESADAYAADMQSFLQPVSAFLASDGTVPPVPGGNNSSGFLVTAAVLIGLFTLYKILS